MRYCGPSFPCRWISPVVFKLEAEAGAAMQGVRRLVASEVAVEGRVQVEAASGDEFDSCSGSENQ